MNLPDDSRTILVPLDGSALGEVALVPATAIASATGDRLQLLSVPEIYGIDVAWYSEAASGEDAVAGPIRELMAEAREEATRYLATIEARLQASGTDVGTLLDEREPSAAILGAADECDAWMICMATHGHGGVTRWAFGSVADDVLRRSVRPVLLVRVAAQQRPLEHVMVPLDGSDLAEEILDDVERIAAASSARVTLVNVVPDPDSGDIPPRFLAARKHFGEAMQSYLDRMAERLRAAGVDARTALVTAKSPAEALLDWESDRGVGLVAMTTHGKTGLARAAFGSVADRLIREGTAPVLVKRVL